MPDFLTVCEQAARAGGAILLDWQERFTAREKAPKDLVTEADLASQQAIRQIVLGAFPDHDFLGEEDAALDIREKSGTSGGRPAEYRWIVDPLDGTANYVHKLQTFAVSIALEQNGRIIVGVVFDPISGELYHAVSGQGAFLNGARLNTSGCRQLEQAMVAFSFSPNVERASLEIRRFIEVLLATQSVRRLGSAALNLAYVAAGRLDSYWATSVKSWDVAAGVLLVREAGGILTHVSGGAFDLENPEFLASASADLQQRMLDVLARAEV